MSLSKYEKNLFEGFLWRFLLDKNNSFNLPKTKGTQIFLDARKKFPKKLKCFSKRVGDGKCVVLEELINDSISSGNLKTMNPSAKGHLLGYKFIISSKLYLNNSAENNYQKNKEVIDYLFKLYNESTKTL